ncbi:tol-pal system-associated acyl-CoA thioesterase [Thiobacillus sp.]|uniref:tol-pal system-associated acyl-CoA thioesterase n=1 Tax=Thiobacillus sp. TaxID=924 RepID=UPI00180F2BF6|nr:tol-pal system-associated acyl-CoA thioesterase [Thiobacillus sp.]MBC2730573.1 tol-pal system-associated acyl-CoA thioesterase [Thiobacillus sp.]MBC2739310.1 tol-pal system-associated acyl-CoA thioesterase [Thiobacillus sp.]MBC2760406.1 tol-pal system-associated acyl-CoA thioesterase [Thiobacillus sp.]
MAFVWPVRVYWEDTDAGGVVYYANYLKFMERARSEWLRAFGFEQDVLRDEPGIVFVVRRVEIDYLSPARFNEQLEVSVALHEAGRASLSVRQELMRGSARLAEAVVTLACVDAIRFKPVKIPEPILQALAPAT